MYSIAAASSYTTALQVIQAQSSTELQAERAVHTTALEAQAEQVASATPEAYQIGVSSHPDRAGAPERSHCFAHSATKTPGPHDTSSSGSESEASSSGSS